MSLLFHAFSIFLVFLLHADTQSESASTKDSCKLHRGSEKDQADGIQDICKKASNEVDPKDLLDPKLIPSGDRSLTDWSKSDKHVEKANELLEGYRVLIDRHKLPYDPQLLVCKAYKESTFDATERSETKAFGISQVLSSTCVDLFNRGDWFRSRIRAFENIKNGKAYFIQMKNSVLAQMELGLAVLHQKSIDSKSTDLRRILKQYRGACDSINESFADSIIACGQCLKKSSVIDKMDICLKLAKRPEPMRQKECASMENGAQRQAPKKRKQK